MIRKLTKKDDINILEFVNRFNDFYQDFYITISKERIFLRNNLKLIQKLLKKQEFYAIEEKEIKGLLLVFKEKGYRPYIKILCRTENNKDLIKYLKWNCLTTDLFIKVKERNTIINELLNKVQTNNGIKYFGKEGVSIIGLRGKEILCKLNKKLNLNKSNAL